MIAAVLGQSNRTLKYISVKIINDENKIIKPKLAKLNLVSKRYLIDILYNNKNKIQVIIIGKVNLPIPIAVLILASSFGLRKLIIVAKSRI